MGVSPKHFTTINDQTQQKTQTMRATKAMNQEPPDSSVGRASAFVGGGSVFESRPHHVKMCKNGNSSSLANARIKGVLLGKYRE